ncbi:helix-turn-helix domain-containing protein [Sphingomonas sp. TREG-RG-20F-R18-01]|uniref:helix-turn-helix domain-containing protein n=1 Tax=Sphingomonas sp. TREG-RG-20F-R18-01 TaxID=2914982 RepID=UPI001F5A6C94|nr:helix-turn-helix domain-containing protein [Sphingomonas sp. TREG-RG-20F-R18-01]
MNDKNGFSRPAADEMISSWLKRVSIDLGFGSTKCLLEALGWPVCKDSEIDFACPETLLRKIVDVTEADLAQMHKHTFTSTERLPYPSDKSFSADITGYIWGASPRDVTRQAVLLNRFGCGSLVIKRPSDSCYDQFHRELAFRELMRTPAGSSLAFARYESLSLDSEELINRLKKAVSKRIIVHFAESSTTISMREQVDDLRKEIMRSATHSHYAKMRRSSARLLIRGSALSDEEQLSIFEAYCSGKSTVSELCLQYGVSYAPIYRCLHRINGNNGLPEISGSTRRRAGRIPGRNKLANRGC